MCSCLECHQAALRSTRSSRPQVAADSSQPDQQHCTVECQNLQNTVVIVISVYYILKIKTHLCICTNVSISNIFYQCLQRLLFIISITLQTFFNNFYANTYYNYAANTLSHTLMHHSTSTSSNFTALDNLLLNKLHITNA